MKDGKPCPRCGSTNVIPEQQVVDTNDRSAGYTAGQFVVYLAEKPWALALKGEEHDYPVKVWICGQCGYTEWFTTNPQDMDRVYQRFQKTWREHGPSPVEKVDTTSHSSRTFFILMIFLGLMLLLAVLALTMMFTVWKV